MRHTWKRGFDKSGIKFIAEGKQTEDDIVNQSERRAGIGHLAPIFGAHDSPRTRHSSPSSRNRNGGMRPNLMAVQAL